MALVVYDRVQETTSTTGTGSVTLLGAVTGYQSFAVVGNGNTTYYCIADQGGANWEVGLGTYSTTGPTLARTTVLASSNAGALVSFTAGTKTVFVTYPAEKSVNLDASGNLTVGGQLTCGFGAFALQGASGYFGQSTGNGVYGFGTGATVSGSTKTLSIGNGGLTGSTTAINIGSAFGTTVNFNGILQLAGSPGTSGQVLTSSATGTPTWTTPSGASLDQAYFLSFMMG